MADFTERQARFIEEYLISGNAAQAAVKAGYARRSANVEGARLLANASISAEINARRAVRALRAEVNADWVLKRFKEISDRCMQAEPVMVFDGEQWVSSGEYKFDSSGAVKATENIGKHIGFFEKDNQQKKGDIYIDLYDSAGTTDQS